ncbi:MAG: protein kinase [Armatimonadetes bacterium]|nr:protein kinase [Armatimonadota bacterium]
MNPVLGDFELVEEIGRGGMGVVYRASQQSLGREVAVKVLPEELAREGQVAARFRTEAQRMAPLDHPGIAHVIVVGEESGTQYFAMQYLAGGSLEDRLRQGPLPVEEAVEIAAQVGEALDYAHEHGVVHRDIKPANIMFNEQGRPVVTDFGIAKAADDSRLTATGMALGTPHYMAPEQAKGNPIDGRADIYALGAVLYEMVCGRPPFQADTPLSVAMKQISEPPLPPRAIAPTVPPWLESIILRALEKEPTHRFAHAEDMAKALRSGAAVPVPTLTQTAAPPGGPGGTDVIPRQPGRQSAVPFVAVGLLALAGIAALIWAMLRPPPPPKTAVVPKVLGMIPEQAAARLREVGNFTILYKPDRPSDSYPVGCIAMQDPAPETSYPRGDVVYLAKSSGDGPPPPPPPPPPEGCDEACRASLMQAYQGWLDAWRREDLGAYMSYYSDSAVKVTTGGTRPGKASIEQGIAGTWGRVNVVSIASSDERIESCDGTRAEMTAYQHYVASNGWDKGTKRLTWWRGDTGWRIARESFSQDAGYYP